MIKQDPLNFFEERISRGTTLAKTGLSSSRVIPKFDVFSEDSGDTFARDEEEVLEDGFVEGEKSSCERTNTQMETDGDVNYLASEDFRSPASFINAVKEN